MLVSSAAQKCVGYKDYCNYIRMACEKMFTNNIHKAELVHISIYSAVWIEQNLLIEYYLQCIFRLFLQRTSQRYGVY